MNKKQLVPRTFNDFFFKRIAAGLTHCLAISKVSMDNGNYITYKLYGWGDNTDLKLGLPF